MPEIDQLVVPLAVPLPPLLLTQLTEDTPTLSEAVPDKEIALVVVEYVVLVVGDVMVMVGEVVSGGETIVSEERTR